MSNTSLSHAPVRRAVLALGACLAVAAPATTLGSPAHAMSAERASVQRLQAHLRPSGDPNGSGEAHFTLSKARMRICANVEWKNIGTPDAAHIHRASDGRIVVDLTGSVTGGSHCATGVSKTLIGKILAHPGRYYFNVHNMAFPAGAIQGKLRR